VIRRLSIAFSTFAAAALAAATIANAANITATATVSAGSGISVTTSATPGVSATLDGTDQTPSYALPLTVSDNSGSGNGWNVTVTSTTFSTGGGSPKTLSTSASTVTGVVSSCAGGATCTSPTNSIGYPLGVPAGATAPTAVKLFNAAASTGLGGFTVTPTLQVGIPANTFAGTYTSTVTVAGVSGP
jgi:hypothetical protein